MGDAALVSDLWVPRSLGPMAATTPPTRPRRRSARSGALPFFQLRPALLHPLMDGFIVAFGRAARWSLPTPAQLVSQDVPHPCRVVMHAGGALDNLRDALQGPHVIGIAIGFSAFGQFGLDLVKLFTLDLRQSPGTSRRSETISARPSPNIAPVRHDLMPHAEPPRDLGWCDALLEQVRRLHAPLLHRRKVAPRPNSSPRRALTSLLYRNGCHPSVSHKPTHHR